MLFSKIQQIAMNNKFVTWLMQFYEFIKQGCRNGKAISTTEKNQQSIFSRLTSNSFWQTTF